MEFNIHSLNVFLTLNDEKSFTRTAKKLAMTQPGVSQHIKSLEVYFKCLLLNRYKKSFELTPEGYKILNYAIEFFNTHENLKNSIDDDDQIKGAIKIASPGAIGIQLYSHLLNLNKKFPELKTHFHYAPNTSIEKELLSNKLDVGFMSIRPKNELLEIRKFTKEELLLILPSSFKSDLNYKNLMELGFINHPDGPDMLHKLLAPNFTKDYCGFDSVPIVGTNNQIGRILEPVCHGLGFTVLPNFAYYAFKNKRKLKTIKLPKRIYNNIYIVKKKYKILPKRYKFVLDYLVNSHFFN